MLITQQSLDFFPCRQPLQKLFTDQSELSVVPVAC